MTGQNAVRRVAQSASGAIQFVGHIPTKLRGAIREWREPRREAAERASGPSTADRQADLISFYMSYEELVDVICDAAHYGPDAQLEERYERLRSIMQSEYPKMRPYVTACLQLDPDDAQCALNWHGTAGDAFEALFAALTLETFLRADDGRMIARIERTRRALNLYGDHLRQLSSAERE